MIITPTPLTITQLLGSPNEQYVIPAYQRRYSWHEKQLQELIDDIELIEGTDRHLLGSIVCLTAHHTAGLNRLELVDGQQRLTTVNVLLHCILERLIHDKDELSAQDTGRLLRAQPLGGKPEQKIVLDSLDAPDFDLLIEGRDIEKPRNAELVNAFAMFRKWVLKQKAADLGTFLYRLKNQCIVIRLDVGNAKDAFKLFETINNRGLRLSPTDIIKNFILGNAARFGEQHLQTARTAWAELIRHLDGMNIEAFFRHVLCSWFRTRVTESYVIFNFKRAFMQRVSEARNLPELHLYADEAAAEINGEDIDEKVDDVSEPEEDADERIETGRVSFRDFMDELVKNAKTYGQIVSCSTGDKAIDRRLRNLRMIKSIQTYGFLTALRVGGCSNKDFVRVLELTESFLLRRHVCRERANENETAFAKLSGADCNDPIGEVTETYRRYCPNDEQFRQEFASAHFVPSLIERARYCLERIEQHGHGSYKELDVAGADRVEVEHIIPQKIKTKRAKEEHGDWVAYLGPEADALHPRYVSRIGNLTLFAGPLNKVASNNPYERKKKPYRESGIEITKSLPATYPEFRFEQVDDRSARLAELAIKIWPMP